MFKKKDIGLLTNQKYYRQSGDIIYENIDRQIETLLDIFNTKYLELKFFMAYSGYLVIVLEYMYW